MLQSGLQKDLDADEVGPDEGCAFEDASVDMGLGGEVEEDVRSLFGESPIDEGSVCYVSVNEGIARVFLDAREALRVGGVGEEVEVHHSGVGMRFQKIPDEIGADEPHSTGDEILHCVYLSILLAPVLTTSELARNSSS